MTQPVAVHQAPHRNRHLQWQPRHVDFQRNTGATVQTHLTTPPKRCVYVEYDISSSATNANTVGVKIQASGDVVNSQSYAISSSTPPPVTLGTPSTIVGTSTTWTGAVSTAWCTPGNWNGGVPTALLNCSISDVANDPLISGTCGGITPVCKSVTVNSGVLTMNAGTELQTYGSFTNNGTFTQGTATLRLMDNGVAATNQTIASTGSFGTVTFTKPAGGTAKATGSAVTIDTLTIPSGSNFEWQVPNGQTLTLSNGLTLPAATFNIQSGGTVALPAAQGISVTGGTFMTSGTNDAYPQTTSNKATITRSGVGSWSFSSSSGTVSLTGFILDYISTSGLSIGGTTTLSALNGGQFTNLSPSFSSVKAIQINTTGSIPATASNVGWNWGAANSVYTPPPSPDPTQAYQLASSTGCGSQTITFDQWFGDFYQDSFNPNPQTKVSAASCTIIISVAASPVRINHFTAHASGSSVLVRWNVLRFYDHQGFNVLRATPGSTPSPQRDLISLVRLRHCQALMSSSTPRPWPTYPTTTTLRTWP